MKIRNIDAYKINAKAKNMTFNHPPVFEFTFDYLPKITAKQSLNRLPYTVKFIDKETGLIEYESSISSGLFSMMYRRWFTPWIIECHYGNEVVYKFDFEESLYNGKVCISMDSKSLGDTLAWIPIAEEFRKKYKCDLYVTGFWNTLLSPFYPNIRFNDPGFREPGTNAIFGLGWYEEEDRNKHKRDPRIVSLQQVASDILGLDIKGDVRSDFIPSIISKSERTIDGKYVCISMESTANSKHWHYPMGWQNIVDYLKELGYKVAVIQKQPTKLEGVIDKSGDRHILERAIDIYHADFSVGVGSGLPWLSWFLHRPVVMISGFSLPMCEFTTKNYRVINTDVCHGCFNDITHKFDRGNWNWCPRLGDTEDIFQCSMGITPKIVKDKINELILKEDISIE